MRSTTGLEVIVVRAVGGLDAEAENHFDLARQPGSRNDPRKIGHAENEETARHLGARPEQQRAYKVHPVGVLEVLDCIPKAEARCNRGTGES